MEFLQLSLSKYLKMLSLVPRSYTAEQFRILETEILFMALQRNAGGTAGSQKLCEKECHCLLSLPVSEIMLNLL